jgi:malate dehydrogenase (oxaloacetate-decarboxylating)
MRVASHPSASYSLTLRCEIPNSPGQLGRLALTVGEAGGDVGAVDIVRIDSRVVVRDITINASNEAHGEAIVVAVRSLPGFAVLQVSDRTFLMHIGGKIEVTSKTPIKTRDDLSMAYTPGVARICRSIARDPSLAYSLTIKRNTVAVVTDGSAVLGLGNIGPKAALPVMEGKAMLFKEFGGVDAFPICLDTQDPDEIVAAVKAISPGFGGINLEDISAPRCFDIEDRLRAALDIPVFHDDQHGTAVVVLAALLNSLKIVGKELGEIRVVTSGVGAAGVAIVRMLLSAGVRQIIGCDRGGTLYAGRQEGMNPTKEWVASRTNLSGLKGSLADALVGADVFIGVSAPGVLDRLAVERMASDPIVFALANPDPEIMPEDITDAARVIATGRSDYPNQINNVLAFPGIFRGALDCQATEIDEAMKVAAARAIAETVSPSELSAEYIVPSVFNRQVATRVSRAVMRAAEVSGIARKVRG